MVNSVDLSAQKSVIFILIGIPHLGPTLPSSLLNLIIAISTKQSPCCQNMNVSNTTIKKLEKYENIFQRLTTKKNARESAVTGLVFTISKK